MKTFIKISNIILLSIVQFSCFRNVNHIGTYFNQEDHIEINRHSIVLDIGDTVFHYSMDTINKSSKFIFLRPKEDTLPNLGLKIIVKPDSLDRDSIKLVFDKSITDCQCYCISYGNVFYRVIRTREMRLPKNYSFYIYTDFHYPSKKYRYSEDILIEDKKIIFISTKEKQYFPIYYYYLSFALEPLEKNKIRFLDRIYTKKM